MWNIPLFLFIYSFADALFVTKHWSCILLYLSSWVVLERCFRTQRHTLAMVMLNCQHFYAIMFIFIIIKFVPFDYLISIIDHFHISDLILKLYGFYKFFNRSYFPLMRKACKVFNENNIYFPLFCINFAVCSNLWIFYLL